MTSRYVSFSAILFSDFLEVTGQGILPCRKRLETSFNEFTLVEAAVERARRLAQAIFGGSYRLHLRGEARLFVDFTGKVVPADVPAFVGGMVLAVLFRFVHIDEQA